MAPIIGFRRLEKQTAELGDQLRTVLSNWEGTFGLDSENAFFEGHEGMPDFCWSESGFSPELAWWLGELCRVAYTPDKREQRRDRKAALPRRTRLLEERSPFCEVHSVHKTGNHASIYRPRVGEGPTVLCFRGTSRVRQWLMNALVHPHGWRRFRMEGHTDGAVVHAGFYVLFKRIWPHLEGRLEMLPRPWIFTGHSLGGALAMIAGLVSESDLICTFGAPKLGNAEFGSLYAGRRVWRVVNEADIVPRLPIRDSRMAEKQIVHGSEASVLTANSGLTAFESLEKEEELPFTVSQLSEELHRPPAWICDHRVGEYCRRLRALVASADG